MLILLLKVDELGIDEVGGLMGFALEEQKKKVIPSVGRWKKRRLRRRSRIVLRSRNRICIVEELMGFALEAQKKKKKLMPSLWGEDREKEAMKENLHCVDSHEAEAALFFGSLEAGGLQGPGRMEKKKL